MALLTMRKHHSLFLLILLAAFLPSIARKRKSALGTDRSARVLNESEVKIDVFWIHATTRAVESSQTEGKGIFFGSDTGISSYIGHSFEIQELPNEKTKKCVRKTCRKAYFTVSSNEDQCTCPPWTPAPTPLIPYHSLHSKLHHYLFQGLLSLQTFSSRLKTTRHAPWKRPRKP